MLPVRRLALMALCAAAVVCLAADRPLAQSGRAGAIALLDRYARGEFEAVATELAATEVKRFDDLLNELKARGSTWIADGPADDESRRQLAAATFALEAARASEWLDWKQIQSVKQLSERRMLGDLPVGGDGFKNADLIYWASSPQIFEWGCALARASTWTAPTERLWHLAALAVAERSEDYEFLVGSPFEARGNAADEFEHLTHASAKLPKEPRLALAQAVALEWRTFPEQVKGQGARPRGLNEAQKIFENLVPDEAVGAEAAVRLGALRMRTGAIDAGLKLFDTVEAKTRDPYLIYLARYFRGQALERKQQAREAEAAYRGALATIPRAQSASIALAALLAKRGARSEAEGLVTANLSAQPQPIDPWRAYAHADDRFWPELIGLLREQIRASSLPAQYEAAADGIDTADAPMHGPIVVDVSAAPAPSAPQTPASPQTPVFRTAADLVTVGVAVRASGTPVGGLRAEDFVVLDNGVPQKIESITSEAVPADITVLVETGDDMQDYLGSVSNQLQKILALVQPADRVRVLAIDTYVTELLPLQRASDRPAVRALTGGGLTSAHDALAAALLQSSDPQRRQLIIAITDAVDSNSTLTAETVREIATQSSAELHIAYVTLGCECPPLVYLTSAERLGAVAAQTGGRRSRFWRPYHQSPAYRMTHDFAVLKEAAVVTGGNAYLPGIFTDRTAAGIFKKVYDDYRHSYVIRYAPQGVKRDGWHELSVTLPAYPNVEISARRGYGVDAPAAAAREIATIAAAADGPDYEVVAGPLRRAADKAKAIRELQAAGNPWPAMPRKESVLALELVEAGLRSGKEPARQAALELLMAQRVLVQRPIAPDEFERLWLWTALAILESPIRPQLGEPFASAALAHMPDEPRLILGRAILADQHAPVGIAEVPEASDEARVSEVGRLYDAAIAQPATSDEARVRKGWLLYRAGHPVEALAMFDAAHPRDDDGALAFWHRLFRGQTLDRLGRRDEALASLRAAVATSPRSQSANVALMNLLLRTGARDEARALAEFVQTLTSADPDPYWWYWAADFRFSSAAMVRLRELAGIGARR